MIIKKTLIVAVSLFLLWLTTQFIPPLYPKPVKAYFSQTGFENIAHGGGHGRSPENVLVTYEHSLMAGADVLEIDIHRTIDGHIVMIHDEDIRRTTDGEGLVREMTLEKLQSFDAGYSKEVDGQFPFRAKGIVVPTLASLLERDDVNRLIIEIKQAEPSIALDLCKQLRASELAEYSIVASFHDSAMREYRSACSESVFSASQTQVALFYLASKLSIEHLFDWDFDILQIPTNFAGMTVTTPELIEGAHRLGIKVHVWTINDPEVMRTLIQWNVDGIITDYPHILAELIQDKPV